MYFREKKFSEIWYLFIIYGMVYTVSIKLVHASTKLMVNSPVLSQEDDVLPFWMSKCLSWVLLLTNITCLTDMISLYGSGQIEVEFALVLSLSLVIGVCFSLHYNSYFRCCFVPVVMSSAFRLQFSIILALFFIIQE